MPDLRVMTWNIASNLPRFAAEAIAHGSTSSTRRAVAMQEVCRGASRK